MKALLLIDIQYDFLSGGALAVPAGNEIIPVLNSIMDRFDLVVATQDWHPAGHKSFASSHAGKKAFETITWQGGEQVLWPDHCVQGTGGAELFAEIDWRRTEAIFRKGTDPMIDSYSGFYDNNRQKSTGLADYLRGKAVKEVFVGGLAADYCVYFTARDALLEGFRSCIIEDATRAISVEGFAKAMKEFVSSGGMIGNSRDNR